MKRAESLRRRVVKRWRSSTSAQKALAWTAVGLASVCVWLLTPPSGFEDAGGADVAPPPKAPEPGARREAVTDGQDVVEANLFTRRRRPAEERWIPEAQRPRQETPDEREPDPAPSAAAYRLLGTVVADGRAESFAVIEADRDVPGPEIYRRGERIGPFTVRAIERDRVILTAGETEVEMHLDPRSRRERRTGGLRGGRP